MIRASEIKPPIPLRDEGAEGEGSDPPRHMLYQKRQGIHRGFKGSGGGGSG
jgi:hypothetical protein